MPFRNFPGIFCLLLCTNALAVDMVSHPVRSLFVMTLVHSLLLQMAYIGSVFLLVCVAALAERFKGPSIFGPFNGARFPTSVGERQGPADCRPCPARLGQSGRRTGWKRALRRRSACIRGQFFGLQGTPSTRGPGQISNAADPGAPPSYSDFISHAPRSSDITRGPRQRDVSPPGSFPINRKSTAGA
ncbi:hypothetical protein ILFOPFJJ_06461 [Ensifer psoraleae]|uniref:exopolysaccharide production repressor protein n=1 Tax=Sinorhizobium psoraleae TaxID=520838 RepID=UPI001568DFA1|nr:hypothetical protein [Sinorhizobium psoraleae]